MSLFTELKRRNVLRVAIAYIAAAWLIIQVLETLFSVYELSNAAIQVVVSLLAIGFVPAVIMAWREKAGLSEQRLATFKLDMPQ